jgi:anti-sigma regulatory factor (Ser/Thr protein kinase)
MTDAELTSLPATTLWLTADVGHLSILSEAVDQILDPLTTVADLEILKYNISLALQELCVNIIRHAYGGETGTITVRMAVEEKPLRREVTTRDGGNSVFDMMNWTPPDLSEPHAGGMGLFLMQQLMDLVEYQPGIGNNRWRMVKFLEEPPPRLSMQPVLEEASEGVDP